jgi:spore maturation protein CgeB
MFKEFPNFFFGQRLFEAAARVFADSKICLNIALNNDVNMRNFEVLGAGGFLLTSRVESLEGILTDGVHCMMYDNLEQAVEKAKYYLEHDEEREKIARAGYDHVIANHTIDHRVDVILEAINKFKGELK